MCMCQCQPMSSLGTPQMTGHWSPGPAAAVLLPERRASDQGTSDASPSPFNVHYDTAPHRVTATRFRPASTRTRQGISGRLPPSTQLITYCNDPRPPNQKTDTRPPDDSDPNPRPSMQISPDPILPCRCQSLTWMLIGRVGLALSLSNRTCRRLCGMRAPCFALLTVADSPSVLSCSIYASGLTGAADAEARARVYVGVDMSTDMYICASIRG
ncbi:hypothetical protein DENSPDRAFT_619677 [Dentipellis sp. KUC8613]|nr:hypothetical protein DENSPDRAFT_619677 [Dentipellis sp. KUC8613]